ncbi:MAG: peroxiredoxin [Hyphomonadaceae bacterium]
MPKKSPGKPKPPVGPGDLAPSFVLPTTEGGEVGLADYEGQRLVLFFYPKDDTSGCTKEALAFSALLPKFSRRGVRLLGVSRNTLAQHERFIEKHGLKTPLGSDESGEVCEAFGVWVEKTLYGRKYMGIERSTFLIGPDSRILHAWRKVKVDGHAEAVVEACKTS